MLPLPRILNTFKSPNPVYDKMNNYLQNGISSGSFKLITDPSAILSSIPINTNYVYRMSTSPIGTMTGTSFGSYVTVGSYVNRVCQHLFPNKDVYDINCTRQLNVVITVGSIGLTSSTFPSLTRNGYTSIGSSTSGNSRVFALFAFYDPFLNKNRMIYPNPGQPLTYQDWNI